MSDDTTPEACAALLMEVAPLVMRTIRARTRSQRAADLSVPQFRVLGLIHRRPGASLSDAAEHVGLTLSAASRLVDGLVARGYVCRASSPADRRALELTLSPKGAAMLEATHRATQQHLAERLTSLDHDQRESLVRALSTVREIFMPRELAQASTHGPAAPMARSRAEDARGADDGDREADNDEAGNDGGES